MSKVVRFHRTGGPEVLEIEEIDRRHVSPQAVARVMQQFQRCFMVDQEPLPIIAELQAKARGEVSVSSALLAKLVRLDDDVAKRRVGHLVLLSNTQAAWPIARHVN